MNTISIRCNTLASNDQIEGAQHRLANPAGQFEAFFSSSGNFATLAAIRRASSLVIGLAERRLLVPAILAAVLTVFDGSAALVQRR